MDSMLEAFGLNRNDELVAGAIEAWLEEQHGKRDPKYRGKKVECDE